LEITGRNIWSPASRITFSLFVMTMISSLRKAATLVYVLVFSACAQSAHQSGQYLFDRLVPKDLRQQVDRTVTFSELKESPSTYEGRVIMLSGVVLNAKRAKERTEIEVLQIPSNTSFGPSREREQSEGRFLAVQERGLDPAVVEEGSHITVIGEVKGTATKSLDEGTYTYPVLDIKQLVDWEKTMTPQYAGYGGFPFYGRGYAGYYPYQYYPYWGPYGYYPYGAYYPYAFGLFRGPSGPAPAPPPSQSIPPQFQQEQ
jgi:outer membrane lipoprotein